MLAATGDLVSATNSAFLEVVGQEWSDTALCQSVPDLELGVERSTGNRVVQDFIVLLVDTGDRLKVQTLEGVAILGMKLNGVVVEAPVVALEGYGLVDELDELRDGWVIVQGYIEENPGFWRIEIAVECQLYIRGRLSELHDVCHMIVVHYSGLRIFRLLVRGIVDSCQCAHICQLYRTSLLAFDVSLNVHSHTGQYSLRV